MKDQVNLYKYEEQLTDEGYEYIAGCDEAGRGALAGPLVVAACILPKDIRIDGINDSKKLSSKKREELYKKIIRKSVAYKIVYISPKIVDDLNIYEATKKGMMEAINGLKIKPDYALIDAMPLNMLDIKHESLIHGDALSASIGAASILAKVARDHYMAKMDFKFPQYGFAHNKGYGTKMHMDAIWKMGPTKIHRKTYYPVSAYLVKDRQLCINFDNDENYDDEEN